ncbi:MAG: polysaccharide deacetylase family protein [Bacteroidales bacterium]
MICIYSTHITPRLRYIANLIFEEYSEEEVRFFSNAQDIPSGEIFINYSGTFFAKAFNIAPEGLLHEDHIRDTLPELPYERLPVIFKTKGEDLHYDVFAACFFFLSRYEEYVIDDVDQHGRYHAERTIAWRAGYLETPLVNLWIEDFMKKLKSRFSEFVWSKPSYRFRSSMDIDNTWAYMHKPRWRLLAATIRDKLKNDGNSIKERKAVLRRHQPDPFENYDEIIEIHKNRTPLCLVFWLMGDYARFDKNIPWWNKHQQELIRRLSKHFDTGVHPSYKSGKSFRYMKKEKKRLENILNTKVSKSRQHYLRLKVPDTFRRLEKLGIKEDYSMGFPSYGGFRSGATFAYYPYDIENERPFSVKTFPVTIMDATLKYHLNLKPDQAERTISNYISLFREHGGDFIPVWHNESLSDNGVWKGWKKVYIGMLNKASDS